MNLAHVLRTTFTDTGSQDSSIKSAKSARKELHEDSVPWN